MELLEISKLQKGPELDGKIYRKNSELYILKIYAIPEQDSH